MFKAAALSRVSTCCINEYFHLLLMQWRFHFVFIEFNLHEKVISLIVIKFDSKINYNVELHDLDNSVAYNSENYFSAHSVLDIIV